MAFKFKKFELPDSGEFSDVDRKGMELLGKHINDQLEMLAEGIKSEEEIVESVKSSLGKLGVSAEKIEEIEKALKEQGSEIRRSMSGSAGKGRTIREQIKAFLSSDEAKRAFAEKRNTALELEIKAAATTITVAANTAAVAALNTEVDRTIHYAPSEDTRVVERLFKGSTNSPNITWVDRKPGNGAPAFIAEGALKPAMDWSYVPETSTAKKVAVSAKISYEMRDDFDYMQSEIDNMLRTSLVQERTKQLLTGDGTGVNLKGIFTAAATYTATALDGTVEMANKADAIRAAILQMRNLNFYPDVVMLNPSDRASIDLTKDSTGHYISDELFRLIRGGEIVESTSRPAISSLPIRANGTFARTKAFASNSGGSTTTSRRISSRSSARSVCTRTSHRSIRGRSSKARLRPLSPPCRNRLPSLRRWQPKSNTLSEQEYGNVRRKDQCGLQRSRDGLRNRRPRQYAGEGQSL